MNHDPIVFTFFLIFAGAALVATLALFARQALLIAYILIGALLGPWGLGLIADAEILKEIAHIGIIFLLFLIGLNLQPQDLLNMMRKTTVVTVVSSLVFSVVGFAVAYGFGFALEESLLIGIATSFSSTIIGLKLLPTTILHHQRTGEVIISILLFQDLIAIVLLMLLQGRGGAEEAAIMEMLKLVLILPAFIGVAWLFQKFILLPLLAKFDRIQEYIFLMAIAWCLAAAELAQLAGLSGEIGAFIAGITLASSPISLFIAESLKPLRDFFLIIFFFSLGAGFNLNMIGDILLPGLVLAFAMMLIKPPVFRILLQRTGENLKRSYEVGYRLGQMSEFSLLIAVLALDVGVLSQQGSYLIQFATVLTFLFSTYLVVMRFQSPIAISDRLRRD
ncbi:MAG: cation:proton antiporter [Gammaproteobacteria bacterium]|nr:cation:proton antiporter [Gammaproteobacteria bacterium]NNJ92626.1 cation:proton antiporter [Gammaproteobacteria bacterium]